MAPEASSLRSFAALRPSPRCSRRRRSARHGLREARRHRRHGPGNRRAGGHDGNLRRKLARHPDPGPVERDPAILSGGLPPWRRRPPAGSDRSRRAAAAEKLVTKTFPIADRTPEGGVGGCPGLQELAVARADPRDLPAVVLATQRSAPSRRRSIGSAPTVVNPSAPAFCVVQNRSRAARRPPRFKAPSTVRERNAAIWSRETLEEGSYVAGVVPVVIARRRSPARTGRRRPAPRRRTGRNSRPRPPLRAKTQRSPPRPRRKPANF